MTSRIDVTASLSIPGWMSKEELIWLAQQALVSKRILEIGVWKGRATRTLGAHCPGQVVAVDPWLPYEVHDSVLSQMDGDTIYQEVKTSLEDLVNVVIIRASSHDIWFERKFSFIFIDGDHREVAVKKDIKLALRFLEPGGRIAGHDFHIQDVQRAIDFYDLVVERPVGSIWSIVP